MTILPASVVEPLKSHLRAMKELHERDVREGYSDVELPHPLARKYPKAQYEWGWKIRLSVAQAFRRSQERSHPPSPRLRELPDPRCREGGARRGDR